MSTLQLFFDYQVRYEPDEYDNDVRTHDYRAEALFSPEMCAARLKISTGAGTEFLLPPVNATTQVAAVRMMLAAYDNWLAELDGYATESLAREALAVLQRREVAA